MFTVDDYQSGIALDWHIGGLFGDTINGADLREIVKKNISEGLGLYPALFSSN
jgi:hypothetical protein